MKEIGEYLKKLRVSHGVSIEEASDDLGVSTSDISNLEDGISRAFKDIFSMKKILLDYAKYLGADINQVTDDFNDYMYEKTSKIDLSSINKTPKEEDDKKIKSPYTMLPKERISLKPIIFILVGIFIVLLIIFVIYLFTTDDKVINKELERGLYEFTNKIDSI